MVARVAPLCLFFRIPLMYSTFFPPILKFTLKKKIVFEWIPRLPTLISYKLVLIYIHCIAALSRIIGNGFIVILNGNNPLIFCGQSNPHTRYICGRSGIGGCSSERKLLIHKREGNFFFFLLVRPKMKRPPGGARSGVYVRRCRGGRRQRAREAFEEGACLVCTRDRWELSHPRHAAWKTRVSTNIFSRSHSCWWFVFCLCWALLVYDAEALFWGRIPWNLAGVPL